MTYGTSIVHFMERVNNMFRLLKQIIKNFGCVACTVCGGRAPRIKYEFRYIKSGRWASGEHAGNLHQCDDCYAYMMVYASYNYIPDELHTYKSFKELQKDQCRSREYVTIALKRGWG